MWQVILILGLSYLISKALTRSLENENDALKCTIKMLRKKNLEQKEKYQERMGMMNKALEQWETNAKRR